MISHIVEALSDVVDGLGLDADARILVLGDPSAEVCGELASDWSEVACCRDRQGSALTQHQGRCIEDLDALMRSSASFDVVIAVPGWRRMQEVRSVTRLEQLLDWMARHSRAVIIEAQRTVLAPDLHDLGPYEVFETLGRFAYVTELDARAAPFAMERPILVASDEGALLPNGWLPAAEFALISTTDAPKPNHVRTLLGTDAVLKLDFACPDYFHQSPALGEAQFLSRVRPEHRELLDLPVVRQVVRGRAVSAVLRDTVAGEPLLPGSFRMNPEGISAAVHAASSMAALGIFHNDFRPWNLLWDGSMIRFIDFADAGWSDRDVQHLPQSLAFAATMAGLMTDELPFGEPFLGESLALAQAIGVGTRWPVDALIDRPWCELPRCADQLALRLSSASNPSAAHVMSLVLEHMVDMADMADTADLERARA